MRQNEPLYLIGISLATDLRIAALAAGLSVRGKKQRYVTGLREWILDATTDPQLLRHRLLLLKASLPRFTNINIDAIVTAMSHTPTGPSTSILPPKPPVFDKLQTSWGLVDMYLAKYRIRPFYDLLHPILIKHLCSRMGPQHLSFSLPDDQMGLIRNDPNCHIALLVTYEDALYISANHKIDLKPCYAILESRTLVSIMVNNKQLAFTKSPSYLLDKGKADTVHPILLTPNINAQSSQQSLTIVSNQQKSSKLVVQVAVVRKYSPEQVLAQLKLNTISEADRILSIKSQFTSQEDDEIIGSTANISLLDPVMTTRIKTPIRTLNCKHLDTFCGDVWLQMNAQTPTYLCPHCHHEIGNVPKPLTQMITPSLPIKLVNSLRTQLKSVSTLVAFDVVAYMRVDMHFSGMLSKVPREIESIFLDVKSGLWEFPNVSRGDALVPGRSSVENEQKPDPNNESELVCLLDSSDENEDDRYFKNEPLSDAECRLIFNRIEDRLRGASSVVPNIGLNTDSARGRSSECRGSDSSHIVDLTLDSDLDDHPLNRASSLSYLSEFSDTNRAPPTGPSWSPTGSLSYSPRPPSSSPIPTDSLPPTNNDRVSPVLSLFNLTAQVCNGDPSIEPTTPLRGLSSPSIPGPTLIPSIPAMLPTSASPCQHTPKIDSVIPTVSIELPNPTISGSLSRSKLCDLLLGSTMPSTRPLFDPHQQGTGNQTHVPAENAVLETPLMDSFLSSTLMISNNPTTTTVLPTTTSSSSSDHRDKTRVLDDPDLFDLVGGISRNKRQRIAEQEVDTCRITSGIISEDAGCVPSKNQL